MKKQSKNTKVKNSLLDEIHKSYSDSESLKVELGMSKFRFFSKSKNNKK